MPKAVALATANRRQANARQLVKVQNEVTKALLVLDDPRDALAVVQRVQRSIAEYITTLARGP